MAWICEAAHLCRDNTLCREHSTPHVWKPACNDQCGFHPSFLAKCKETNEELTLEETELEIIVNKEVINLRRING